MRIDTVTIRNYGSFYGEHVFQIAGRGLCVVLGDNQDEPRMSSNGAGKSTVSDALDWCLWGKVPRDDHVDSIINEMAGKDCEVDVELTDDSGAPILVRRYRNVGGNNGCMLMVAGKELTSLDTKETQNDIERILGMDREVFHAAVLMAQTDLLRFADAKDSDRMAIMTKILQMGEIDDWLGRAKEARKAEADSQVELKESVNQRRGQIAMAEQQIPGLKAQSKRFSDERADKLRETTVALNRHLENIPKYEKNLAMEPEMQAELHNARLALGDARLVCIPVEIAGEPAGPPFPARGEVRSFEYPGFTSEAFDRTALMEPVTQAAAEQSRLYGEREVLADAGRRAAGLIKQMAETETGECPECWQTVTGEHLAAKLTETTQERDTLRARWTVADGEYKSVVAAGQLAQAAVTTAETAHEAAQAAASKSHEAARQSALAVHEAEVLAAAQEYEARCEATRKAHEFARQEWQRQKDLHLDAHRHLEGEVIRLTARRQKAESELERLQAEKKSLAQTQEYTRHLREVAEETRTKPNPYQDQLDALEQLVSSVWDLLTEDEATCVAGSETAEYYDFWVEAFGARGLKSYILDSRLQEMSDAANHWVKLLTGGTLWVRFETQTKGRSTGKLSNKMNIRVFRWNPDATTSERNYRSWSGGEKQRVSLGIDFGLSRLIAQRATKSYDVLIMDELFRHLDGSGKEAVVEMLHHIRREKSSVIVVDHDKEIQGGFENRVLIRKKDRCSTILELDDGGTEQERPENGHNLRAEASVP